MKCPNIYYNLKHHYTSSASLGLLGVSHVGVLNALHHEQLLGFEIITPRFRCKTKQKKVALENVDIFAFHNYTVWYMNGRLENFQVGYECCIKYA